MLEEQVVHLPESPLSRRCFRRLSGALRTRVHVADRKIPEHESQVRAELSLRLFNHSVGGPALTTLVIAVLDEEYRRVRRTSCVVALRYGEAGCEIVRVSCHFRSPIQCVQAGLLS